MWYWLGFGVISFVVCVCRAVDCPAKNDKSKIQEVLNSALKLPIKLLLPDKQIGFALTSASVNAIDPANINVECETDANNASQLKSITTIKPSELKAVIQFNWPWLQSVCGAQLDLPFTVNVVFEVLFPAPNLAVANVWRNYNEKPYKNWSCDNGIKIPVVEALRENLRTTANQFAAGPSLLEKFKGWIAPVFSGAKALVSKGIGLVVPNVTPSPAVNNTALAATAGSQKPNSTVPDANMQ